jgi:hypothetical protein
MPKRRLTAIRLDKIAAVDAPCQQHATVAIIKRAPVARTPGQIIKATFQQALSGSLVADAVREAFYGAFDNMYEGQSAFRTALIDELSAGGDGGTATAAYKAWLSGLVDQALTAAKAAGAATITPDDLTKAFKETAAAWLEAKQQEQKPMHKFKNKAELQAAIAKFAPATSLYQDVVDIQDSARELGEEGLLPAAGPLAKAAPTGDPVLAKRVKVLELPADLRKHYDGLPADRQDAFLAKSATDQKTEVDALNQEDPVAYTTTDGEQIRKSAGPAVVAMAKRLDAQAKTIDTLTKGAETSAIEKAVARYPHVAKERVESMLKSVAAGNADDRKAVEDTLSTMNKAAAGAFRTYGSTAAGQGGGIDIEKGADTPQGKMGAIVKRIAKERNLSDAEATVIAIQDPDYQVAYAESVAEVPGVAAYAPTV